MGSERMLREGERRSWLEQHGQLVTVVGDDGDRALQPDLTVQDLTPQDGAPGSESRAHGVADGAVLTRPWTCMSCQPSACIAALRRMPSSENSAFAATRHDARFWTECSSWTR